MRRISKRPEPNFFLSWKSGDWDPAYADLQNPEKEMLHQALCLEQGSTCCYCGREISIDNSHVEHFRPQSTYKGLDLSYDNLFASCMRGLQSKPQLPATCGVQKGDWFSEPTHVSPLDPVCEEQFNFSLTGTVTGTTDAANVMVRVLGLDTPFLRNRRMAALEIFDAQFLLDAQPDQLMTLRDGIRQPTPDGKLTPFYHVISRYCEYLLEGTSNK